MEAGREMLTDEEIELIRNEPPYFQEDQPVLDDEVVYDMEMEVEEEKVDEGRPMRTLEEIVAAYEDMKVELDIKIRKVKRLIIDRDKLLRQQNLKK